VALAPTSCDDGGVVELSGSVIESPHGLHSNAYKFPAKARLMICNVIGRPQNRAADFVAGCEIFAHCLLMHAMADSGLDVDQATPPLGGPTLS
jgi:hypothetical protein